MIKALLFIGPLLGLVHFTSLTGIYVIFVVCLKTNRYVSESLATDGRKEVMGIN